ncbi:hypothetical protein [Arthrobacter mobilis]|uniref:Acyl-CoA dehydrogenase C-terminal domain-containing protein n=1 Tax=Arthrobacter mobilis TaxID=2724944 RepID=A0A7X6HEW9_9MICC|nr:hypothetical protein [Arthrobacter mobilis]NKX55902.1 hypothetical protein [Arthrobacter mobilis]
MDEQGEPKILENGLPDRLFGFVPRDSIVFHDNCDVMGLVASGSVGYELPEQFIPDKHLKSTFSTTANRSEAIYSLGPMGLGTARHAGVMLGIIKRALEEVVQLVDGKSRQGYPVRVGDYLVFLHGFARKDAAHQGARAYALAAFENAAEGADAKGSIIPEQNARLRPATTWIHTVADDVISFCHLWGGTQPLRTRARWAAPHAISRRQRSTYCSPRSQW